MLNMNAVIIRSDNLKNAKKTSYLLGELEAIYSLRFKKDPYFVLLKKRYDMNMKMIEGEGDLGSNYPMFDVYKLHRFLKEYDWSKSDKDVFFSIACCLEKHLTNWENELEEDVWARNPSFYTFTRNKARKLIFAEESQISENVKSGEKQT